MRPHRRPLLESFNYALQGIIHVLRTQRNLRIHFAVAVLVLSPLSIPASTSWS